MSIIDIENLSKNAIINPEQAVKKSNIKLDVCIFNFSKKIMDVLIDDGIIELTEGIYICCVACDFPMYRIKGTNIGVILTMVGAPMTACMIEEVMYAYSCNKFVVFGSCGGLDKSISPLKIIVPDYANRDEGMSYHYAPPADYIQIKNCGKVCSVLEELGIDYVTGKVWSTDSFYRETLDKYNKVKGEGCIAVDMELSACQAVADFRGAELYYFLYRADNLDADKWDKSFLQLVHTDKRLTCFFIALEIAKRVI